MLEPGAWFQTGKPRCLCGIRLRGSRTDRLQQLGLQLSRRRIRGQGIGKEAGRRTVFLERGRASGAPTQEMRIQRLAFLSIQRADHVRRKDLFELFVFHDYACSQQGRNRSLSLFMPSLMRVLIVPNGWLSREAISWCESPS